MEPPQKKVATLAFLVRDNQVLLGLKVRKGADIGEQTLNGPGGKLDPGQTLAECVVTEVYEEVGIQIDSAVAEQAEVAVVTLDNGGKSLWEVHMYLIDSFSGEPRDTEEMIALNGNWWYPITDLPFDRMLASDQDWIPKILHGERFRAYVVQNADASELTSIEFSAY